MYQSEFNTLVAENYLCKKLTNPVFLFKGYIMYAREYL